MTRVVALGPADFLCGLSKGGILRIRPGLAQPCLLAEGSSMPGIGFIKKVGVRFMPRLFGVFIQERRTTVVGKEWFLVAYVRVCVLFLWFSKSFLKKWEYAIDIYL